MEVPVSRGTGTLLYLQTNQTTRQKEVVTLMAVRKAELVLVRHGETASNRSHIIH